MSVSTSVQLAFSKVMHFATQTIKVTSLHAQCIGCQQALDDGYWCFSCANDLPWLPTCQQLLPGAVYGLSHIDYVVAYFKYEGVIKTAWHQIKYGGAHWQAKGLGALMSEKGLPAQWPKELVYQPVPLHMNKQKQRGYNQAEWLLKGIGQPACQPNALIRVRDTSAQASLGAKGRRYNLMGAFRAQGSGPAIALVDDILTTGATLDEAGRMLKRKGWRKVYALVNAVSVSE